MAKRKKKEVKTVIEPVHLLKGRDTLCGIAPFAVDFTRIHSEVTCPKCQTVMKAKEIEESNA